MCIKPSYDHILAYQMRPINTFFYLMCYIPDNDFICAYIEMLFDSRIGALYRNPSGVNEIASVNTQLKFEKKMKQICCVHFFSILTS